MNLFVTSTGTDIGKTIVSRAIIQIFRKKGFHSGYYKAVASGCESTEWGLRSPDELEMLETDTLPPEDITASRRFLAPISPDKAAEREGHSFSIDDILEDWSSFHDSRDRVVVEGIGGVAVPFNEDEDVTDLIDRMGLPVILVVSSTLGTISHTRTAMYYLEGRNVDVRGIVLTPEKGREIEEVNLDHLRELYPNVETVLMPEWTSPALTKSVRNRVLHVLEGSDLI